MSTKSTILIENISALPDPTNVYSEKRPGASYHRKNGGLHTYVYDIDSFSGVIKLQGTLASYPGEADWVDIDNTTEIVDSFINGETVSLTNNFIGNFVWIRAAYVIENGSITQLRYNY